MESLCHSVLLGGPQTENTSISTISIALFWKSLLQDMFRWIDKHKKNIEHSRRAPRPSECILNGLVALQMDVLVFFKGLWCLKKEMK